MCIKSSMVKILDSDGFSTDGRSGVDFTKTNLWPCSSFKLKFIKREAVACARLVHYKTTVVCCHIKLNQFTFDNRTRLQRPSAFDHNALSTIFFHLQSFHGHK